MKNHSKETENVSKNDYCFTQEKRKKQRFSSLFMPLKAAWGIIMNKIIIIGCPGSGKSTFARKLRDITNIPLFYLDMIWHKPDGTNVSREEFDSRLNDIIKMDKWIIDGNYQRTIETRLKECDTVFLLDFPVEVCLSGAKSRIGKKREDLPWVEHEFDEEFKQFIIDFSKESLPQIYKLLQNYMEQKDVIIFKSRKEADDFLCPSSCVNMTAI